MRKRDSLSEKSGALTEEKTLWSFVAGMFTHLTRFPRVEEQSSCIYVCTNTHTRRCINIYYKRGPEMKKKNVIIKDSWFFIVFSSLRGLIYTNFLGSLERRKIGGDRALLVS